jgi:hypothetical protein
LASDVDDLELNHEPFGESFGDQRVILIEAAGFGDAEFYGRWLWPSANYSCDHSQFRYGFHERVTGSEWAYKLDFAASFDVWFGSKSLAGATFETY